MSSDRQRDAQQRIDAQAEIVASLEAGTPQHEMATKVLLLMLDSLHLLSEIDLLMGRMGEPEPKPAE